MNTQNIYNDCLEIIDALESIKVTMTQMKQAINAYIESLPKIPDPIDKRVFDINIEANPKWRIIPGDKILDFEELDSQYFIQREPYNYYQDGTPDYMGSNPIISSGDIEGNPNIFYSKSLNRYVVYDEGSPFEMVIDTDEVKNLAELSLHINKWTNSFDYYEHEELLRNAIRELCILEFVISKIYGVTQCDDFVDNDMFSFSDESTKIIHYLAQAYSFGWIRWKDGTWEDTKSINHPRLAIYKLNEFNKNREIYLNILDPSDYRYHQNGRHEAVVAKIKDIPDELVYPSFYAALNDIR